MSREYPNAPIVAVGAIIVGATNVSHLRANQKITELTLTPGDIATIRAVLQERRGPKGDVFELERDREGRHGRIMKYNLLQPETYAT